jgi:hypothetical protein
LKPRTTGKFTVDLSNIVNTPETVD